MTTPEAFTETNDYLLERGKKAIEIIRKEAEGNVIVVSYGDVITTMLEGVVERKVSTEKYYVLDPYPAALGIVARADSRFDNYSEKMTSKLI